jgi:hypothetical protein
VCLSTLLSACGAESDKKEASLDGVESKAKKAVLAVLKDPDSARFGQFTQVNEKRACLTVNARNSLGGYTGDQQAFLAKGDKNWDVVAIEKDLNHTDCIKVMTRPD